MFYLSNIANSILQRAHERSGFSESEFGYRFQVLASAALRSLDGYDDLYENNGAGQPDCYSNQRKTGFEIKCRKDPRVELDSNSWKALRAFESPRLIAMAVASPPFPIWIVDLTGRPVTSITLEEVTPTDQTLEQLLKPRLSELIEATGCQRIVAGNREEMQKLVGKFANWMFPGADQGP
jgi:hypothetical protein